MESPQYIFPVAMILKHLHRHMMTNMMTNLANKGVTTKDMHSIIKKVDSKKTAS
jgi:hypothetical protein